MKKMFAMFLSAAMFCCIGTLVAQDDVNARFQAMAEGDGVVQTKLDAQGNLASFMVIGHGQVRKSLPKQKAVMMAKKEAERNARNAVSKYFNTSVKWQEDTAGEMVCKHVGTAAGEEPGTSTEESATTEVSAEKSSAASEAALAVLRWVWTGYDSNGMVVQIYGWKFADVRALINASKVMGAAARKTVQQAKSVEAARLQDPNAINQAAQAAQAAPASQAAPAVQQGAPRSGQNATPAPVSSAAADAADFF